MSATSPCTSGSPRRQLRQNAAEAQRVLAERRAHPVVAGRGRVAFVEDEIDDAEHRRQTRRELAAARHLERHLRLGERLLRAHDALRDRRLGHEKGTRDLEGGDVDEKVRKGIELVYAELTSVVERSGLERIEAEGAPFDPNEHEAVMQDDGEGEPHVDGVLRTGWKLKGRVLRPSDGESDEEDRRVSAQREWFEKDYYAVLGVPSSATEKELSRAYKKLAKQHHPDANQGNAAAEERFKEISAAYDVVGDKTERAEYDEVRQMVASGVDPRGRWFGPVGSAVPAVVARSVRHDGGGLGDIFGNLFGGGGSGRRRGGADRSAARSGPRDRAAPAVRGRDPRSDVDGAFRADATCSTCAGSGADAGHDARDVPRVSRRGDHRRQPGTVLVLAGVPDVWRPRARSSPTPCPTATASASRCAPAR